MHIRVSEQQILPDIENDNNLDNPRLFWEIKNAKEQMSSQTQVLTTSFSEPIANFLLLMIFMATFLHVFLSKASFTSPQAPLQGKS